MTTVINGGADARLRLKPVACVELSFPLAKPPPSGGVVERRARSYSPSGGTKKNYNVSSYVGV